MLEAVGDRRVVLTPSGVLSGVPWTLLPGYVGRPVTVAQSATAWLARRTTPLRTATAGFVAGPRVARAEDEVVAAAKEWPAARVLLGADATAAAVSELADAVDVLHVAAHGRHSAENAMFAGLQLVDGPWFGYDIDRLQRVPDVVLLSACEVGRSTVRWGEELIGMTTAWLHAGARCVIASPAAINDQAAYDVLVARPRATGRRARPGRRPRRVGAGGHGRHRPGAVRLLRLTGTAELPIAPYGVSGDGAALLSDIRETARPARSHRHVDHDHDPFHPRPRDPGPPARPAPGRAGRAAGSRCASAAAGSASAGGRSSTGPATCCRSRRARTASSSWSSTPTSAEDQPLRLVRRRVDRSGPGEVRDLTVRVS